MRRKKTSKRKSHGGRPQTATLPRGRSRRATPATQSPPRRPVELPAPVPKVESISPPRPASRQLATSPGESPAGWRRDGDIIAPAAAPTAPPASDAGREPRPLAISPRHPASRQRYGDLWQHWKASPIATSASMLRQARDRTARFLAGNSATPRLRIAAVLAAGPIAIVIVLAALVLHTPGWYVVPHVAESRQQSVRDRLERMTDEFSMALLKPDVFDIELTQDELNDWLAMCGRIWPAAKRAIPPEWSGPVIRFDPGRIMIAAQYKTAVGRAVVSGELALSLDGDMIVVRPARLRIGHMPVPLTWLTRWVRGLKLASRATESGVSLTGNVSEGFRLPTRHTWWNGARDFRIRDVRLTPGAVALEIEPLGPRPRRNRSLDQ